LEQRQETVVEWIQEAEPTQSVARTFVRIGHSCVN